jgi:DNA-binding NarL/FixJ family response regulator
VNVIVPELRPTVLLANDHNGFLERLCKLLAAEFDVLGTTMNGRQAVSKAVFYQPDVIILDLSMPGLNGLEAALEMRNVGVSSKLVLLTVPTT